MGAIEVSCTIFAKNNIFNVLNTPKQVNWMENVKNQMYLLNLMDYRYVIIHKTRFFFWSRFH